jgi:hypothetical protein
LTRRIADGGDKVGEGDDGEGERSVCASAEGGNEMGKRTREEGFGRKRKKRKKEGEKKVSAMLLALSLSTGTSGGSGRSLKSEKERCMECREEGEERGDQDEQIVATT